MKDFFTDSGIYYRANDIDPKKKTLVLIHGVSGSSSAWLEFEKHFKADHNVVALDLRGHGFSKKLKEYNDYEIASLSEDIRKITELLGLENIILVSHSFGTLIALNLMPDIEDKVDSIVFLSPIFYVHKVRLARITSPIITQLASVISLFPFYPGKGGHINYSKYRNTGDWNLISLAADIKNTSARIFLFCLKQLYAFKGADVLLGKITKPTLIIHGTKDTVMPIEEAMDCVKKINGCEFISVENGCHVLIRDNEKQLADAIGSFIGKR